MRPTLTNPWAAWAIDCIERAVRAYAAAWCAIYVGGDAILDFYSVEFKQSLVAALFALFVSSMFSLAGKRRGAPDSASLMSREKDPPTH